MNICSQCGQPVNDEDKYCKNCGAEFMKLATNIETGLPSKPKRKKKLVLGVVIGAVVCGLLFVGSYFLFYKSDEEKALKQIKDSDVFVARKMEKILDSNGYSYVDFEKLEYESPKSLRNGVCFDTEEGCSGIARGDSDYQLIGYLVTEETIEDMQKNSKQHGEDDFNLEEDFPNLMNKL